MSSKFNVTPTPMRRPPICDPPPKTPYEDVPLMLPRQLGGFARWTDLDPALEFKPNVASYITLLKINDTPTYVGQTPKNRFHLVATVYAQEAPNLYFVGLDLYELGALIEYWAWTLVPVAYPFDTGLLTDIHIPGKDLRIARFME